MAQFMGSRNANYFPPACRDFLRGEVFIEMMFSDNNEVYYRIPLQGLNIFPLRWVEGVDVSGQDPDLSWGARFLTKRRGGRLSRGVVRSTRAGIVAPLRGSTVFTFRTSGWVTMRKCLQALSPLSHSLSVPTHSDRLFRRENCCLNPP